jgi:hypothetical protein
MMRPDTTGSAGRAQGQQVTRTQLGKPELPLPWSTWSEADSDAVDRRAKQTAITPLTAAHTPRHTHKSELMAVSPSASKRHCLFYDCLHPAVRFDRFQGNFQAKIGSWLGPDMSYELPSVGKFEGSRRDRPAALTHLSATCPLAQRLIDRTIRGEAARHGECQLRRIERRVPNPCSHTDTAARRMTPPVRRPGRALMRPSGPLAPLRAPNQRSSAQALNHKLCQAFGSSAAPQISVPPVPLDQ